MRKDSKSWARLCVLTRQRSKTTWAKSCEARYVTDSHLLAIWNRVLNALRARGLGVSATR